MMLRDLVKMQGANDGMRTLSESIMAPELVAALKDWRRAGVDATLIGGLALSYYVKPRMTQAIDFLLLSDPAIPESVAGFRKVRRHAFQHHPTHVEVEIVTAQHGFIPADVIAHIIGTAVTTDGFRVASPTGLVASKLFRLSMQDAADIVALIIHGGVDLDGFAIPPDRVARIAELRAIAERERMGARDDEDA